MSRQTSSESSDETLSQPERWLSVVKQKVSALRFGVVQVVVHEGRVVQIECTEKVRLDRSEREQE